MKSERLKKLEAELSDLDKWLSLGLVPKKEIEKHKAEIAHIKHRLKEESERLQFLKESGDNEEFELPKRSSKQPYSEPQTMPGLDVNMDSEMNMETETFDLETSAGESTSYKEEATIIEDAEEDPFSDKNRWKRGVLADPDADNW